MRTSITVVTALAVCASIACGGESQSPPPTTPTPTATSQPAGGTAPQSAPSAAQPLPQAVAFDQLIALLPDVNGWTKGKPRGEQITMGVEVSQAKVEYTRDDASIDLMITDSSRNPLVLAPFTMFLGAGFSERSSDGYAKAAPLSGNPGFERWNNDAKRAEVTVIVGNRFVVQGTGHDVANVDPVRAVVKAVDLGRLASLK